MNLILVRTLGPWTLTNGNSLISATRPTVTHHSEFLSMRISAKQLRVVSDLKPTATDEEFVKYLEESEGNIKLAIDSFLSKYAADAVDEDDSAEQQRLADQAKADKERKEKEVKDAEEAKASKALQDAQEKSEKDRKDKESKDAKDQKAADASKAAANAIRT